MSKEEINSILVISSYLIKCKLENQNDQKAKIVRDYLTTRLANILSKRKLSR